MKWAIIPQWFQIWKRKKKKKKWGSDLGEQFESDYIPEACVFDRPPSLGGSVTDVLGSRSKPADINQKQPIRIILHYFIIW